MVGTRIKSHAAMSLIRSGVRKIRVIDYDIVTLSSLNRHAFAVRRDVGKMKTAVVRDYAKSINPLMEVECIDDAFLSVDADRYIKEGSPDFVLDCIDDIESKAALIHFCLINNIKIVSSLGASGKKDPSMIRYGLFDVVIGDAILKKLRHILKVNYGYKEQPSIPIVYSCEAKAKQLTALQDHQKENIEAYRINFNERVRTLPVFACIPAIFGQSLAAYALTNLADEKLDSEMWKHK